MSHAAALGLVRRDTSLAVQNRVPPLLQAMFGTVGGESTPNYESLEPRRSKVIKGEDEEEE